MRRRVVLSSLAILSLLVGCASTSGAGSSKAASEPEHLLFVQSSAGMESSPGRLTLKGVSPTTVFFADRPEREAGHSSMAGFVATWGEGADSFAADPPNATLSVLSGEDEVANVVVTLSNPRLEGTDLTYDVNTLEGDLPETGGGAALFIDVLVVRRAPVVYAPRRRVVVVR